MLSAMKALIAVADGTEEMEAVIVADVLRRAEFDVTLASIGETLAIRGSRKVQIVADCLWQDADLDVDILILPGGMEGMQNLRADPRVLRTVCQRAENDQWIAAICAAPLILQTAGILKTRRITSHPSIRDELGSATYVEQPVVVDGHLITSRGPGTAMAFALRIIHLLAGKQKADGVATGLMLMWSDEI